MSYYCMKSVCRRVCQPLRNCSGFLRDQRLWCWYHMQCAYLLVCCSIEILLKPPSLSEAMVLVSLVNVLIREYAGPLRYCSTFLRRQNLFC